MNADNFREVINEIGILLASNPNNCFYFGFNLSISDFKLVIEFTRGGVRVRIPISIIQK